MKDYTVGGKAEEIQSMVKLCPVFLSLSLKSSDLVNDPLIVMETSMTHSSSSTSSSSCVSYIDVC